MTPPRPFGEAKLPDQFGLMASCEAARDFKLRATQDIDALFEGARNSQGPLEMLRAISDFNSMI